MSEHSSYDVVVVGARAAGAATAMLLARAGLRVLVVDRSRYGADTLSTHALLRGGVLQLHRWGLLDRVIAAGTPPVRRTTFRYATTEVPIEIAPSHGVTALYAPRRTVLDPILVDAAVAAGATVRYGVIVRDVHRDDTGRVDGIIGHDERGRPFVAKARWVVGADGVRSSIAGAVGAAVERWGFGATGVVYGYWSGLATDGYEWDFRRDGAAGVIPTNDGLACVFVAAPPSRVGRGGPAVLHDVLADASPGLAERLADATPVHGVRSSTSPPGFLRRAHGSGWALVGDAGYWKDPISAHGLTDALRDAELLARAVVAAAEGLVADDDALADYQATRDRVSVALFDVVDKIAAFGWTDDEIPFLLRDLSRAGTDEVELLGALDQTSNGAGVAPPNQPVWSHAASSGGASAASACA